jgi:hypothetical protein
MKNLVYPKSSIQTLTIDRTLDYHTLSTITGRRPTAEIILGLTRTGFALLDALTP